MAFKTNDRQNAVKLLKTYQEAAIIVMGIFRWDLQLHFFWGFALTLLGQFWLPLYGAGVAVTLAKEALDLWSKGCWSWDDVWSGILGSTIAFLYLFFQNTL